MKPELSLARRVWGGWFGIMGVMGLVATYAISAAWYYGAAAGVFLAIGAVMLWLSRSNEEAPSVVGHAHAGPISDPVLNPLTDLHWSKSEKRDAATAAAKHTVSRPQKATQPTRAFVPMGKKARKKRERDARKRKATQN